MSNAYRDLGDLINRVTTAEIPYMWSLELQIRIIQMQRLQLGYPCPTQPHREPPSFEVFFNLIGKLFADGSDNDIYSQTISCADKLVENMQMA